MRKIFSLGLLMALSGSATLLQAQITETGSKVGINNTAPDATLDIMGNSGTLLEIKAIQQLIQPIGGDPEDPFVPTKPDFAFRIAYSQNGQENQPLNPFDRVFTIEPDGKTQIGYFPANPSEQLAISGSLALYHNINDWAKLRYPGGSGELRWKSTQGRTFSIINDNSGLKGFTMAPDGRVGIRTDNLSNDFNGEYDVFIQGATLIRAGSNPLSPHSLYIEGSAVMEEGVIKLKAAWPDYVFDQDYVLMPLSEVAAFIEDHGHLPGMPSAAQVAEEGMALGETQRLLTEKVEELTLYLLELSSQLQEVTERNKALYNEVETLREEITTLKAEK